jgi:predicted ABC-type ATPase
MNPGLILTKARVKRIRIFAGPNGSGKTTIINAVRRDNKIPLGCYINADDIERSIKRSGKLRLSPNKIEIKSPEKFYQFSDVHGLILKKKITGIRTIIKINKKSIVCLDQKKMNAYVAALIADFLREEMLSGSTSFRLKQ